MKEQLLLQIYDHYINSSDYNGLNISVLDNENCSWSETIELLIELIEDGVVGVISSKDSNNIYINRLGFMPVEDQICDLKNMKGDRDFCCYPLSSYLETHRDVSEYKAQPFNEMLALGTPQLLLQYFHWDVLDKYSEDPRFDFEFRDYEGKIHDTESLPKSEHIYLKSFGIGRDKNGKRVIAAFPRYLCEMSPANQIHWHSKMIERDGCSTIQAYIDNTFNSCWNFPDSVYTAVLKEMCNINQITLHIWNKQFFKEEFLDERPKDFGSIFKPTLTRYNAFLLVAEKMIPNNIESSFFDIVHNDGKDDKGKTKGTIHRLRDWLKMVNSEVESEITNPIRKIRELRQKPAHKIENNKYDYTYFDTQQVVMHELLEGLILFRSLLLTHPKATDVVIKYKNEEIIIP